MAKKVILRDDNSIELMPVTRGELVLDSNGEVALRSAQFLATDSWPGLTTLHFIEVSPENVTDNSNKEVPIIQLKSSSSEVHPVTTSDAVIVPVNTGNDSLTNVLREMRLEINDSKLVLDDRPTEGNTTHGVSSDGIFQELKETVGNIQILLQGL